MVGGRFARGVPTYYVEWHLREAWRTLLFSEPHPADIDADQDPALSASRSEAAMRKAVSGKLEDRSKVHCFRTLIEYLETITKNTCQNKELEGVTFEIITLANDKQQHALDLIKTIDIQTGNQ